jgi:hypothetical protein
MDINVKLYGLKYNYKRVQWCFCKIVMAWNLSGLKELISYWKFRGICPRFHGPGPCGRLTGPLDFIK